MRMERITQNSKAMKPKVFAENQRKAFVELNETTELSNNNLQVLQW